MRIINVRKSFKHDRTITGKVSSLFKKYNTIARMKKYFGRWVLYNTDYKVYRISGINYYKTSSTKNHSR